MFELYREVNGSAAESAEENAEGKWRWQLTVGDKVLARSEESWGKRSAAKAAVDKFRTAVAGAAIVEKLS